MSKIINLTAAAALAGLAATVDAKAQYGNGPVYTDRKAYELPSPCEKTITIQESMDCLRRNPPPKCPRPKHQPEPSFQNK